MSRNSDRAARCPACGSLELAEDFRYDEESGGHECPCCSNIVSLSLSSERTSNNSGGGVCWEYQAGEQPIRLGFSIKVF